MISLSLALQVHNHRGWCQLFVYSTYVTSFLSVWYVVCFSFDRYLIVRFPLKRQVLCRPARAKIVVSGMTALAMVLYIFALWTPKVQEHNGQSVCEVGAVSHNVHFGAMICEHRKLRRRRFPVRLLLRDSSRTEPSHGAFRQATPVVDGGSGHGPGRSILYYCSGWVASAR